MYIRTKAPLRLGLGGGGTDVSPYSDTFGGIVLNATIDMYVYTSITNLQEDIIEINAADIGVSFRGKSEPCLDLDGTLDLHKGVYNRMVAEFNNNQPIPLRMTTFSDAPAGSGLGTSSTLVVSIVTAFAELLKLSLGEYDIAQLAYQIERVDLGMKGGKQDQYAATFGGFNLMQFKPNNIVIVNPLRVRSWIADELELSLVLFYTGASRESSKIIDDQIENTIAKNDESIKAMHKLRSDALTLKDLLLKAEFKAFGQIMGESWMAKKKLAKSVTSPLIDDAYRTAIKAGAYSGKVSGAGGGGFMMFVVNPVRRIQVINALNKLDGSVMNFHFTKHGVKSWQV